MSAIYPGDKVTVDHPSCHDVALTMVGWHLDRGKLILQPPSGPPILVDPANVKPLPKPTPISTARPGARLTDPDTSHEADRKTNKADDQRLVLLTHAQFPAGLTDFDLAALHDRQQTSLGKRRHDLMQTEPPLIEYAGHRRPSPSGSPARVWRITEAGRALADELRKETA